PLPYICRLRRLCFPITVTSPAELNRCCAEFSLLSCSLHRNRRRLGGWLQQESSMQVRPSFVSLGIPIRRFPPADAAERAVADAPEMHPETDALLARLWAVRAERQLLHDEVLNGVEVAGKALETLQSRRLEFDLAFEKIARRHALRF